MEPAGYHTKAARPAEAEALADLRAEAMRASLEAVGRFDLLRARQRFLDGFSAADTQVIYIAAQRVGVYVRRRRADHLYLDHLYILPQMQGMGIGRKVLESVQHEARDLRLPIRLIALSGSPANDFYRCHGFVEISRDALDTSYEWRPSRGSNSEIAP